MIDYLKENYRAMGWRLFLALRWAAFLGFIMASCYGLKSQHPSEVFGWVPVLALILLTQWIIIGQVKPEVLLPWTKLGGSEIEAKEG